MWEAAGVVVHRVELDMGRETRRRLERVLSEEERAGAARFRVPADCDRFVVTRATLRLVLARETGTRPTELRFAKGPWGKPYLPAHPDLRFNVSHSGALALIAVSRSREVGIDVERCEPGRLTEAVASRFLSRSEKEALAAVPSSIRALALLRTWCRKEAYVKARGEGLSLSLDSFDVGVDPNADSAVSRLLVVRARVSESADWAVHDLEIEPQYVAALAFGGPSQRDREISAP